MPSLVKMLLFSNKKYILPFLVPTLQKKRRLTVFQCLRTESRSFYPVKTTDSSEQQYSTRNAGFHDEVVTCPL